MSKTSTKTKTNTKTIAKRPGAAVATTGKKRPTVKVVSRPTTEPTGKLPRKAAGKAAVAAATNRKPPETAQSMRATMPATAPTSTVAPRISKLTLIENLVRRAEGATLADLMAATGWQQHSVRAVLSGLRKAGHSLLRDRNAEGESRYRIGEAS